MIETVNPATGATLQHYPAESPASVLEKVEAADRAFREWSASDLPTRARALESVATQLEKEAEDLARISTAEMGKPLAESLKEIEKCVLACRHYAGSLASYLKPEVIETPGQNSVEVHCRPLGTVLLIMPWNFPFWQVIRAAIPILAGGNTVLLKHASKVTGSALALQSVFTRSSLPEGSFHALVLPADQLESIIGHPAVIGVSFTGSTRTGKKVAARAAWSMKRIVCELGGSDPYLIFADADLGEAARTCAASRLVNNGQSCISAKRFIVEAPVYDAFTELLREEMETYTHGDPIDPQFKRGPLSGMAEREELHQQVMRSIDKGAQCLLGGKIPKGKGAYYPATLLGQCPPGSPAFKEETFGPVAAVASARTEAEMLSLANRNSYGLGGAIFTADLDRAKRLAVEGLECGIVGVNRAAVSSVHYPFGGIKDSGLGRELGKEGLRAFCNIKTILS